MLIMELELIYYSIVNKHGIIIIMLTILDIAIGINLLILLDLLQLTLLLMRIFWFYVAKIIRSISPYKYTHH